MVIHSLKTNVFNFIKNGIQTVSG